MRYYAHRIAGICTGLITADLLCSTFPMKERVITTAIITGASAFGSILPDIDEPSSHIGRKVKPISSAIKNRRGHRGLWHSLFIVFLIPAFLTGIYLALFTFGYRLLLQRITLGIFSVLTIISLYRLLRYKRVEIINLAWFLFSIYCLFRNEFNEPIYYIMFFGIFIGYLSHLFLDSLTTTGVPFLYPFSVKKFHILNLKTGRDDIIVIIITIVLTILILFFRNYIII